MLIENHETHFACNKRIKEEGGKAKCCFCFPHNNCEFEIKQKRKEITNEKIQENKQGFIMATSFFGVFYYLYFWLRCFNFNGRGNN
jgi:hypothetical protein